MAICSSLSAYIRKKIQGAKSCAPCAAECGVGLRHHALVIHICLELVILCFDGFIFRVDALRQAKQFTLRFALFSHVFVDENR